MSLEGVRCRIPKGTVITGTFKEGIKEAKTTYVVTLFTIDEGYEGGPFGPGREAMVCWAGSGGYWHYAPLSDVEVLDGGATDR